MNRAAFGERYRVVETGCWLWTGYCDPAGYGRFGRNTSAHRFSYATFTGPLVPGMVIDHICRVRCCVNPAHLRQVTRRVNALENNVGPAATNAAKACCPKCGGAYGARERNNRWRECVPCTRHSTLEWDRAHRDTLNASRRTRRATRTPAQRDKDNAYQRARGQRQRDSSSG